MTKSCEEATLEYDARKPCYEDVLRSHAANLYSHKTSDFQNFEILAGGSSTKGGTSGVFLGKGVATMTKKVQDEEMRKRLDTTHEFLALIAH
eukprot:6214167-Pleurochrysis_carterae.AAC.1